jgi:hypothetical protein
MGFLYVSPFTFPPVSASFDSSPVPADSFSLSACASIIEPSARSEKPPPRVDPAPAGPAWEGISPFVS